MKAFVYQKAHQISDFGIVAQEVAEPACGAHDLLVRVKAFAFNPVDYKIRQSRDATDTPVILGWDAAGVVEAVGSGASGFTAGDEVYYSGDLTRPGSYAELQAVDHRLVSLKPRSLDFTDAAALPLTSLTAYEAMLERGIHYTPESTLLIIGGAGGVGSIAIQLLKTLTPAKVITTATRPETIQWVKEMGADHVIGRDLQNELKQLGIEWLDGIFGTTHTADYLPIFPDLLRPFGHLAVIDDPPSLDILPFKRKALSVHWEFMFSKSMFGYEPDTQGAILREVAELVDAGRIRTTRSQTLAATVENVRVAHETLERGTALGKMVMEW